MALNIEKITSRLDSYGYNFKLEANILKIWLPMLCYLKIRFYNDKTKMTSHLRFGFRNFTLESNFIIYGLGLYILAWFKWTLLNKAIFLLLGILLVHFVICIIKIETMRILVHKWIEEDSSEKDSKQDLK